MDRISIVVPCYNEEMNVAPFYEAVTSALAPLGECGQAEPELIFVDDGSCDGTLAACKRLAAQDNRVKYISFSRNFGKEAALLAGLRAASGSYVCVMDVDGQDPPEMLLEMYARIREGGCDCVAARRFSREGEPKLRSAFARLFYKLINSMTATEIADGARDFRLMTRQMTDAVLSLGEASRFSKGLFSWVGFRTEWLPYQNIERRAGTTKWNFRKLFAYSIDGFVNFTTTPLAFPAVLGALFCAAGVIWGIALLFGSRSATAALGALMVFLCGVLLLTLGLIGQYLARMFTELKNRPAYLVRETNIERD